MKGDCMKRIICVLLILCMIPAFSFAVDLDEFNTFSSVLGASELDMNEAKVSGKHIGFVKDGCNVYIDEVNGKIDGIYIQGQGDSYLAYCCAAVHVFDPNGNTTQNHGQVLTMYLMAHETNEYMTGQTQNGYYFFIQKQDNGFFFLIGEA